MLVYLNEYRRDDASETVRKGEAVADTDSEEYFGKEELGPDDDWERIDHKGQTVLKKASSHEGITAVSVPEKGTEDDDPDLPGRTIQLRKPGEDTYYVQQAEIIEAIDENP